jgi:hypothetical protein
MLPGPNLIKQCHHCQKPIAEPTIISGNTFGETVWTDGKRDAIMLPVTPWLVKCPHCRRLLWLDEASQLGEEQPFREDSDWPEAKGYLELSEQDYLATIEMECADSRQKVSYVRLRAWCSYLYHSPKYKRHANKMRYIRMRAWWAANDRVRHHDSGGPAPLSEKARRNMEAILGSLSEKDEHQRLMKAELLRELGRFEEAERLLSRKYSAEVQRAVQRIAELVRERSTAVAVIS